MPFVHPELALAALGLLAAPIVIHLLNRRRYVRVEWAAMGFLRAAIQERSRRLTIERLLLLAIRVAVIGLLGLALARPYFPFTPLASVIRQPVHRVIVLDNSGSMSATVGGGADSGPTDEVTRLERASRVAETLFDSFLDGDAISLITMASPTDRVLAAPTRDVRRARLLLHGVTGTERATDVSGALAAAREILDASPFAPGNRTVYVISDFSFAAGRMNGVGARDGSSDDDRGLRGFARDAASLAERASVVLVNVGRGDIHNLAVVDLSPASPIVGTEFPIRVRATVNNGGDEPVPDVSLRVTLDDRIVRAVSVGDLPAGASRDATFSIVVSRPGEHVLKVSIQRDGADDLGLDDARWLVLNAATDQRVLVVDGRPGATRMDGAAGYVATALAPLADRPDHSNVFTTHVVGADEFQAEPLHDYEVVVLCDVGRLAGNDWDRLLAFVRVGGGCLVFGGPDVDVEDYNSLGWRGGEGLLPAKLAAHADSTESLEGSVRLDPDVRGDAFLSKLGDRPDSGLFLASFGGRLGVESAATDSYVVLRYTDGAPAIVLRTIGRGTCGLVTSSADMTWTNLPAKGDFVTLVVALVSRLAGGADAAGKLVVGDVVVQPLGGGEVDLPLSVTSPDGKMHAVTPTWSQNAAQLRFDQTDRIGPYVCNVGGEQHVFSINAPPEESQLHSVDRERLATALPFAFTYSDDARTLAERRDRPTITELSGVLGTAVFLLMLVESVVASRQSARGA